MSRQAFADARKWCGRLGIVHWERAGACPNAAAYGAFILGQLANPDASGNLKGWDFNGDLVACFVKDVTSCKTMEDLEHVLEKTHERVKRANLPDPERTFGSKNYRIFCLKDDEAFDLAKNIKSWDMAKAFNFDNTGILTSSATSHRGFVATSEEICLKYGLSSLMIPLHVGNPVSILDRVDETLGRIVQRMGLEDSAALGAFGRLAVSLSIKDGQAASGLCTIFDDIKEGCINLPVAYDEKTFHHEMMHWVDTCARWSLGVNRSPYVESTCLSASPVDEYYRIEPAIRATDALIEFRDKNERYLHECARLGRDIFGLSSERRDYFREPQEILARAFEYGVNDTFDREFEIDVSLIDRDLGESMNVLSRKFIDAIKDPVMQWSSSNRQKWAERLSWNASRLERVETRSLDDASEMLFNGFSKIQMNARKSAARLGTMLGMRP